MKIGVLTGGGDCPGLNAVIRAIVRKGSEYSDEIVGFKDGWKGLIVGDFVPLDRENTRGILHKGGTILGTSRTNPFKQEGGLEGIRKHLAAESIEWLIPIGGEDTLGVGAKLGAEGVRVVGVPKTIDNDLSGTDYTFGFDSAITIATEAIDRLHTTAESHHRVMVCEVMGRHAGWIAIHAGMAGGADVVLIPERPFDVDEIAARLKRRHESGQRFSIVVAAEGATPKEGHLNLQSDGLDAFGHPRLGGVGSALGKELEARTGYETRVTVLGHVQRGGSPTAFDRVLGTRFGVAAVEAVHAGSDGMMVALRGAEISLVSLAEAAGNPKTVGDDLYSVAEVFFG
ncbi:MAG: 6-phosphofructokinase [Actinomycetota bacterium]